ncbi:MAG: CoA transferase [Candidatus Dormibacteraeota bacterium]|nr:CoA transferase [Candidatus Dormibacteraeota bacterium]
MGPLTGVKVVEFAGIGPGPFAGMMLADMGADVLRVARPEAGFGRFTEGRFDVHQRGKHTVRVDLKEPKGVAIALRLVQRADCLIEGFRPGVMERLGLGPEQCLARNPRLVYGRMTGWGQDGRLAQAPGHDIDYIALAGVLWSIGRRGQPPTPPVNLIGDFGGGGMLLSFGLVCGLLEARSSGQGQVVDAAMVDGSALLASAIYGMHAAGLWSDQRGTNLLDGGAHFYDVYETADGEFLAVGAIEPQFHAELVRLTGLDLGEAASYLDPQAWPAAKERLAAIFRTRTRDEWCDLLEGSDACVAPVLRVAEAPRHPHNRDRGTFLALQGVVQPAPAPRFSRTPPAAPRPPSDPDPDLGATLEAWGLPGEESSELREAGVIS